MAFESIPGVKVISYSTGQTLIFGDFFAVYFKGDPAPRIYKWRDINSIKETKKEFIITADTEVYILEKASVSDVKKFFMVRSIIEGAIAANPSIEYSHLKRILPPKYYYSNCDTPPNAYIANGTYNEKEISYSNVTLLNTRIGSIFKIISVLMILAMFLICHFFVGDTQKNWTYFLPISIFTGVIVSMFVYLVCAIIAKCIYSSLLRVDPSVVQPITFVVCPEGFAAVESCIYNGSDMIKWEEAAYFIETNYVYIIFKNKKAVFWLPKRFFKKEEQTSLSNFIANRLQQK